MGKTSYTDEDKARVLAVLAANDGNVKRTARDTAIPEQTVRDWKKQGARGATPARVQAALPAAADAFVVVASGIRDKAMALLESRIDMGDIKTGELITAAGVLTDKINLARGHATSRQEQVRTGPSPEEFAPVLVSWLDRAVSAAKEREADIEDAEFEESAPEALPPAPTN